jgi:DNA-binding transcriptional regulator LsrR (DeoR family)
MARVHRALNGASEERLLARIAWAYHVEGLTQEAVADKLGITRLRVNKALGEARRIGLVRVSLNTASPPASSSRRG